MATRTRPYATLALLLATLVALSSVFNIGAGRTGASSHREAPTISQDPTVDNTDVYAFVSPDRPDTVTILANWWPFQDPAGGPNFYRFADDAVYDINIDTDADAVADLVYRWDFETTVRNPNTFLYNTGPVESLDDEDLNIRQFYSLTEFRGGASEVLATGLQTPPSNIGPKSTPNYEALAAAAIYDIDGLRSFAGQRDDPFFVDLGATFDLLNVRVPPGSTSGGIDALGGFNVQTIAIQIPIAQLRNDGVVPTDPTDPGAIIGVWSTTSRFSTTVIDTDGTRTGQGDLVQVSRLGNPLVNEVVVPLALKDVFNASQPVNDAQFLPAVLNPSETLEPSLPEALTLLLGVDVPEGDREDLVQVFLTGVPGLNQPPDVVPSELARLNLAIPPSAAENPLGVLGGDTAGFPNGRRLGDDVVDIELRVVAGALVEGFNVAPNNQLGDGVSANDLPFLPQFPFAATPHQGFDHPHHGFIIAMPST
ncbi:MAG: DUF4331 domain-containing protein, partial [Chloroflexota bacterium]|nr:DUF4331 domain-containing protein [Chloroflexota bacterium]